MVFFIYIGTRYESNQGRILEAFLVYVSPSFLNLLIQILIFNPNGKKSKLFVYSLINSLILLFTWLILSKR